MRRLAGFGGRCPQRIPLWGLAFGLHARRTRTGRRRPPPAADEVKQTVFPCVMIAFSAIKCRGSPFAVRFGRCRYAARRRSQRRRPAQGAPDDAGTATRTVPAVRDTSVLAELLFKTRVQQGLMIC